MTGFFDDVEECPLLEGLTNKEKNFLAGLLSSKKVSRGKVIFLENMPGESLYIIRSGSVKVSRILTGGREKILAILGPPEMFGELALLGEGDRAVTISVVEDSELLFFTRKDFDLLCKNQPQIALKILKNILSVLALKSRESRLDDDLFLRWCFGDDGSGDSRAS